MVRFQPHPVDALDFTMLQELLNASNTVSLIRKAIGANKDYEGPSHLFLVTTSILKGKRSWSHDIKRPTRPKRRMDSVNYMRWLCAENLMNTKEVGIGITRCHDGEPGSGRVGAGTGPAPQRISFR
jgi:hypothetical protein